MRNNKSKKIFIILIIVLILALIAGGVFAFIATDLFKSEKTLFFKYASQIFDTENGFIDGQLSQYAQKLTNSPFEHETKITSDFQSEESDSTDENSTDDFSISFQGKVDLPSDKIEELIKLNYSKNVNLPITFKKLKDTYGIKIEELSKRFFTVSSNDIEQSSSSSTGPYEKLKEKLDFKLTEEEKQKLKDTYFTILDNKLDNESFTKVSTIDSKGYALNISSKKIKEIMLDLLNALKTDTILLPKFQEINASFDEDFIDDLIDEINYSDPADDNIIITVYESEQKLNKIEIQYNDDFKIAISKKSENDSVTYLANMEAQMYSADFTAQYTGLAALNNVEEKYDLSISTQSDIMQGTFGIAIENNVDFNSNDVEIKDFAQNEAIDMNSLGDEKASKLYSSILAGVQKLNKQKQQEANYVPQNPLFYMIPILGHGNQMDLLNSSRNTYNNSVSNSTNTNSNDEQNNNENDGEQANNGEDNQTNTASSNTATNTLTNTISSNTTNTSSLSTTSTNTTSSSNLVNNMENVTKESFNEKFKQYEGESVKGNTVKSLVMQIIANNMIDDGRKIEVTGDVKLTGDEVPESIVNTNSYKVKCSVDSEGYVNKVNIVQK